MKGGKTNISQLNINRNLYSILSKEVKKISGELDAKVEVEYGNGRYGDFVFLSLKSNTSIPFELCITNNYVDLSIGKKRVSIYEMERMSTPDRVILFEKQISHLFNCKFSEIEYSSGRIDFIDKDNGEIIFSERNFFSIIKGTIIDKIDYQPWINN